jgi:hypothetical protein
MKIIIEELSTLLINAPWGRFLRIGGNNFFYCAHNATDAFQYPRVLFRLPPHVNVYTHNKDTERIIYEFQQHQHNLR